MIEEASLNPVWSSAARTEPDDRASVSLDLPALVAAHTTLLLLEGTSILTPQQALTLGSLEIPGSARHVDITVTMEPAS